MSNGELEVDKHHNRKHSAAQLCVTKSLSAQLRKVEALGVVFVFPQYGAISFVCNSIFFSVKPCGRLSIIDKQARF